MGGGNRKEGIFLQTMNLKKTQKVWSRGRGRTARKGGDGSPEKTDVILCLWR